MNSICNPLMKSITEFSTPELCDELRLRFRRERDRIRLDPANRELPQAMKDFLFEVVGLIL